MPEDLPLDLRTVGAIVDQLLQPDPAWWERLDRIGAPTLLLAGGPDSHVPRDRMAQVAERIPDCRLLTLGGGHFVHREQEAAFLAAVGDFLG